MEATPWDPANGVLVRTRFHVTRADIADAQRTNMRWRYLRLRAFALPLLLGLALCVITAVNDPGASALRLAEPFAFAFVVILGLRLATYVLAPVLLSRGLMGKPYYREEWEVEFSRAGLRARTPSAEIFNTWDHYTAQQEGRRTTLLYHTSRLFQFMPKSALTPDQRETVATLTAGIPRR